MSESLQVLTGAVVAGLDVGTVAGGEPAAERVLAAVTDRLEHHGYVNDTFRQALLAREREHPTGLPTAVPCALPHTDAEHVRVAGLAVATLARPVAFGQMGAPGTSVAARWVVVLCVTDAAAQVEALQHLVLRMRDTESVEHLLSIDDDATLADAVTAWLAARERTAGSSPTGTLG